nr:hypothetical protein Iba_chr14bCG11330 [Ipomoea batatas]
MTHFFFFHLSYCAVERMAEDELNVSSSTLEAAGDSQEAGFLVPSPPPPELIGEKSQVAEDDELPVSSSALEGDAAGDSQESESLAPSLKGDAAGDSQESESLAPSPPPPEVNFQNFTCIMHLLYYVVIHKNR